jgi:hypothetical protein
MTSSARPHRFMPIAAVNAADLFGSWTTEDIRSWTEEEWSWFLLSLDVNPLCLQGGISYENILRTNGDMSRIVLWSSGGWEQLATQVKHRLNQVYRDIKVLSGDQAVMAKSVPIPDDGDDELVFIRYSWSRNIGSNLVYSNFGV